MGSDSELLWDALVRTSAKVSAILEREVRAAVGVSVGLFEVLRQLDSDSQPSTMAELADRVVLSRTRVSRVVDELATIGLVAREANPDDGRSLLVSLTTEGQLRLKSGLPAYRAAINGEFEGALSKQQIRQLIASLNAIQSGR